MHVASMTCAEAGAYVKLLCFCWIEDSLPNDCDQLARLIGMPPAWFRRVWPRVSSCFEVVNDRLRHKRLDHERAKQRAYRASRRASADVRWAVEKSGIRLPLRRG